MPAHSFDRFYIVMKFVLPTIDDLKLSPIQFVSTCNYLNNNVDRNHFPTQFISNLENYCRKFTLFIGSIRSKLILIITELMKY